MEPGQLSATFWEKPYIVLAFSVAYLLLFHKMRNLFSVTHYDFNTELTPGIIMLILWLVCSGWFWRLLVLLLSDKTDNKA